MDAKLKADWLKALRSGEYEQGNGSLYCDGAYCCLGVLNKVAARPMMYGFSRADGIEIDYPTECELIRLNDSAKKSFLQIADYIEQNL